MAPECTSETPDVYYKVRCGDRRVAWRPENQLEHSVQHQTRTTLPQTRQKVKNHSDLHTRAVAKGLVCTRVHSAPTHSFCFTTKKEKRALEGQCTQRPAPSLSMWISVSGGGPPVGFPRDTEPGFLDNYIFRSDSRRHLLSTASKHGTLAARWKAYRFRGQSKLEGYAAQSGMCQQDQDG